MKWILRSLILFLAVQSYAFADIAAIKAILQRAKINSKGYIVLPFKDLKRAGIRSLMPGQLHAREDMLGAMKMVHEAFQEAGHAAFVLENPGLTRIPKKHFVTMSPTVAGEASTMASDTLRTWLLAAKREGEMVLVQPRVGGWLGDVKHLSMLPDVNVRPGYFGSGELHSALVQTASGAAPGFEVNFFSGVFASSKIANSAELTIHNAEYMGRLSVFVEELFKRYSGEVPFRMNLAPPPIL